MINDSVLRFPSEQVSVEMAVTAGLIQDKELVRFTPAYGIFVQGQIKGVTGWWVRVRVVSDVDLPAVFLPYVTAERPEGLWGIA